MLFAAQPSVDAHPAFAALPARAVSVGRAGEHLAVHVSGALDGARPPLLALAGFQRNMSDFADFAQLFPRLAGSDWPLIFIDLKGRGRSTPRRTLGEYLTQTDAQDVIGVLAALGVPRVVCLGQGHGGLVAMLMARDAPRLSAGTILIDAAPVTEIRGLVRLKNNLDDLVGRRSETAFRSMVRRMLSADYPSLGDERLMAIGQRTHVLDRRGRVHGLFDPRLQDLLRAFEHDDVLAPQWSLFDALRGQRLMLVRTQRTDLVRRDVFDEMARRRPDAKRHIIEGQGSPALLDTIADVDPIARFASDAMKA
jgi:pimeloyl-ACP methyl ester carboxylesterase